MKRMLSRLKIPKRMMLLRKQFNCRRNRRSGKRLFKLIGRVPLLNAEMEVELSLQVEAGLFAEEKLAHDKKLDKKLKREYEQLGSARTSCKEPPVRG
jgi:hypothetical protein